jgi:site-specific DNA recombinase
MQAEEKTKVLGYIRVSTKAQANEGFSLPVQKEKVRAYALQNGLDLVDVIEDGGRSAESLDRKGIREVFARLDAKEVSGVVIAKLDRLTRSVRDWAGLVEDRFGVNGGARLYSASESIDLTTANGRFVANILISCAQCELETGVERSESVMGDKRTKGQRLGTIPYGSKLGDDGLTLIPCLSELETLLFMRWLRDSGMTLKEIASNLDETQYPTREGKPWQVSTISKLLRGASDPKPREDTA